MISLCLESKVEIYVPGTVQVSHITDTSSYVERTARYLSELFGGSTVSEEKGYYVTDNGNLVAEPVYIVWAFCSTEQLEEHVLKVIKWAEMICQELQQESVAVVINGHMFFVRVK